MIACGKTTWVRKKVESYISNNPHDNILCITFTNRAAEELGKDLDSSRVYSGTIHSFINDFISSFFSHDSIIELYFEKYKNAFLRDSYEMINLFRQSPNTHKALFPYMKKYLEDIDFPNAYIDLAN